MARLDTTKTVVIRPGDAALNLRTAFGLTLDNGKYYLSNDGPGNIYVALAPDGNALPVAGHTITPSSGGFGVNLKSGQDDPFVWHKGGQHAILVFSPYL